MGLSNQNSKQKNKIGEPGICHLAAGSARVSVVPGVVVAAYLLLLVVVIPLGDGRGKPRPGDNLLQLRTCSV